MTTEELDETKALMERILALEAEVTRLSLELAKWQEGGVTEDLLRANDGYIRIGSGVSLGLTSAVARSQRAVATLMGMGFAFKDGNWYNTKL